MNNFSQVFNNKILDQSSLEEAVQAFNEEMEKTLDKIALKEEKMNIKRQNNGILANYLNKEKLSEIEKEET